MIVLSVTSNLLDVGPSVQRGVPCGVSYVRYSMLKIQYTNRLKSIAQ